VAVDHQALLDQTLLDRRAVVADEITALIGKLGVLVREEAELGAQLSRIQRAAGSCAAPFDTATTVMDAINSELTRAGLTLRRGDPSIRLGDLVDDQTRRYRSQMTGTPAAGTPTAA
jgi:hypothetical protein